MVKTQQARNEVRRLIGRMNRDRMAEENLENYETCAALRDGMDTLSDFVLGYSTEDDIAEAMLFWIQHYGEPVHCDTEDGEYYVTYALDDPPGEWLMAVDRGTFLDALSIITAKELRRKRRGTK